MESALQNLEHHQGHREGVLKQKEDVCMHCGAEQGNNHDKPSTFKEKKENKGEHKLCS